MKFKDLTKSDIRFIAKTHSDSSMPWMQKMVTLTEHFSKSERCIRYWIKKLGLNGKAETKSEHFEKAQQKKHDKTKKRFIVSWAQSNTPVLKPFLKNMECYAKFINAEILIIAGRYSNRLETLKKDTKEYWVDDVLPYLDANRHDVHKYMSIMSDVKVSATSQNVLTGMQGMSGVNSCIFGSPRVQMTVVPALPGQRPKLMLTSGAVTKRNYTDSRLGQLSSFHHTFGFCIVEIKNEEVHFVRQITATENGSFSDLIYNIDNGKVTKNSSIAGIVLGDYHIGEHDEIVIKNTLKLLKTLKPESVVVGDVFDGHSVNHHEAHDPFIQFKNEMNGSNSIKSEVDAMLTELKKFEQYKVVITRGNHDYWLDRYLKETDWRKAATPKNSLEYMNYSAAILSGEAEMGIVPWLIKKRFPHFITLDDADSYIINGFECGMHGSIGINGAKPSINGFRSLNTKLVIGHSHSPKRFENVLQVGTSSKLNMKYAKGPSSWLQSHVILYKNKKAGHIFFTDGEFTTFKY